MINGLPESETDSFMVESDEALEAAFEAAKQRISSVLVFDWTDVQTQIGHQDVEKLPPSLGIRPEMLRGEGDHSMNFRGVTLRNVIDDKPLYSTLVVTPMLKSERLTQTLVHELVHVVTMELAYQKDQIATEPCTATEELAVDVLAGLIIAMTEHSHPEKQAQGELA